MGACRPLLFYKRAQWRAFRNLLRTYGSWKARTSATSESCLRLTWSLPDFLTAPHGLIRLSPFRSIRSNVSLHWGRLDILWLRLRGTFGDWQNGTRNSSTPSCGQRYPRAYIENEEPGIHRHPDRHTAAGLGRRFRTGPY